MGAPRGQSRDEGSDRGTATVPAWAAEGSAWGRPVPWRRVIVTWPEPSALVGAFGYPLLLALTVVEGPAATVLAGFLSARGYLSWPLVLAVAVVGDLVGDVVLYGIGRCGHGWLHARAARWLGRAAPGPDALEHRLRARSTKLLFVGKLTHAAGAAVLVAAGAARVPILRFVLVNAAAAVPKSTLLLAVGYFFGQYQAAIGQYLFYVPLALLPVAAVLVLHLVQKS